MTKKMNRRKFIQQSAALGVLAVAGRSPIALGAPRRGANEELRVACLGIRGQGGGHIHSHAHAKNVRVVTLCDIDERLFGQRIKMVTDAGAPAPKTEWDFRRVLDDKDVDCVSIATPNHWHALATIWACQAGKDVYVEKPCSHNIFEGRKAVEAAARYKRIVQHGTQARSIRCVREAIRLLHEGIIGDIYMARACCFKRRDSIGIKPDSPVPAGVHYNNWLGPAPERAFNENRFHYEWHWHWDYGNGDIGNQGVHQMDIAMWGLGKDHELPVKVSSMGGRYTYEDQGQTPNTQIATCQYADGKMLVFEVRGRQTNDEWGVGVGNLFYGSKGYMAIRGTGGPFETVIDGQPGPKGEGGANEAFTNFHAAVRSGKASDLNAPIEVGHYSAAHCHLANIAYRVGRTLSFDPQAERFVSDPEADALLTRDYRAPFVVPQTM
ncbi:MAG: Gfo/Idh/MocA family oxidoreductase [Phycisphaerae bacterium]|nr:Gfo/Idh/MocA family oxidoreductase [Phycisphaerae bacterium]